jgi:hypothetical protein
MKRANLLTKKGTAQSVEQYLLGYSFYSYGRAGFVFPEIISRAKRILFLQYADLVTFSLITP